MHWVIGESAFSFMSTDSSQQFLDDLDRKLWTAADRLRANLDAAVTNTPSSAQARYANVLQHERTVGRESRALRELKYAA